MHDDLILHRDGAYRWFPRSAGMRPHLPRRSPVCGQGLAYLARVPSTRSHQRLEPELVRYHCITYVYTTVAVCAT